MTPIQLLATISMAFIAVYLLAGIATYIAVPPALTRHQPEWVFVAGWPLVWMARSLAKSIEQVDGVETIGKDPNRWRDETRDDRAQMGPSPIWIPGLLTLLVIVGIVLNELVLHIVPARGPLAAEGAPEPTSQFILLTVAVAALALTKVVGWYRRRGSADQ